MILLLVILQFVEVLMSNDMKRIISERLKKYIKDNNLEQKNFGKTLEKYGVYVPQSTISSWVMGTREPRTETKKILFDILGISVENTYHEVQVKKYPIMINNSYEDEKIDVNVSPLEFIKCDYCMIYDKEDMKPLIDKNDILFIKQSELTQDNDLIVISIDNKTIIRRIFIKDNIYTLLSENNNAPPITITDSTQLSQLGIVRYIQKKV